MSFVTPRQVQSLQIARRQVERASAGAFDEAGFRIALRSTGDVLPDPAGRVSSKALTQRGFESMMALLEDMGYRERDRPADHWRSRFNGLATTRQVYEIKRLAAGARYSIESMCQRHSGGRCTSPEQLTPKQAHGLIEAYKDIIKREAS